MDNELKKKNREWEARAREGGNWKVNFFKKNDKERKKDFF